MPLVAPTISVTIIMMKANASEIRMPAKICGAAEGSWIWKIRCLRVRRNVRPTSSSPRSMPRTPSIVFSRIGNMQTNPMSQIFGALPMPISVMVTGTRPVAGIERANCTPGWNAMSSSRSRPNSTPKKIPRNTASR